MKMPIVSFLWVAPVTTAEMAISGERMVCVSSTSFGCAKQSINMVVAQSVCQGPSFCLASVADLHR